MTQMIGIVGFVCDQLFEGPRPLDQLSGDRDVVRITGGQDQDARPALLVRECVELARASATGLPKRLLKGPPFPPAAERCALMCVLSIAAKP